MIYTYLKDPTTKRILLEIVGNIRCFDDESELAGFLKKGDLVIVGGNIERDEMINLIGRFKSAGAKVIVVTTFGQEFDQEKLMNAGADMVFTKPFSPKLLAEKIRELKK